MEKTHILICWAYLVCASLLFPKHKLKLEEVLNR